MSNFFLKVDFIKSKGKDATTQLVHGARRLSCLFNLYTGLSTKLLAT